VHLKVHRRKKDGKEHRYFSIVESRRVSRRRVVHRTVVYLGEINDTRQAAWRKTLEVFDEREQEFATLSLFPDEREIAADVDGLQVKLSEMQLERPREPSAAAGWVASCGGNSSWMSSGRGSCRRAGRMCRGRKCCGCWW
jgi:hypothetical protein